ncbi:MAG: DUF4340 domain-containing protein [Candidatus Binatia bacterium]
MTGWIRLLTLLLVVQAGLAVWLNSRGDNLSAFDPGQPLLSLDISRVDRVTIEERGKKPLVMTRQNGGWVLPAAQRFPVSPTRFREFTEKLLGAKPSWPVGHTKVAAKQLKVSEDNFERRIRFFKDDEEVGVVFLGSSPAFRKVHARLGGDGAIYSLNFNVYEARTNPADWYNRSLLNLSREEVARIDMGAYAVKQDAKGFIVEGLAKDEETDAEGMRKLISGITSIGFEDVLGKDGKETFDKSERILEYAIEMRDGSRLQYTVVSPQGEDYYILKTSEYPYYFKVRKSKLDEVRNTARDQLVKKTTESGNES